MLVSKAGDESCEPVLGITVPPAEDVVRFQPLTYFVKHLISVGSQPKVID